MRLYYIWRLLLTLCSVYTGCLWGAPIVTQITPNFGPTIGGNVVNIIGSGLTGATAVNFGTVSVPPSSVSENIVTVNAPPYNVASVIGISVTTPEGTSSVNHDTLYVYKGDWFAYVNSVGDNTVVPINLVDNSLEDPIPLLSPDFFIVITPDGTKAYVSKPAINQVAVIDLISNTVITNIPVAFFPENIAISPNGQTVYVCSESVNIVTTIDVATNTVGTPIIVNTPSDIAISLDSQTAYITSSGLDRVIIVDLPNTITGFIPVGVNPQGLEITPNGQTAYVIDATNNDVTPIDLATGIAATPISLGVFPLGSFFDITISPNGQLAYVPNRTASNVIQIDLVNNMVIPPTIAAASRPVRVAFTPDGLRAYVTNNGSANVTPIDVNTSTPGTSFFVGQLPLGIAISPDQAPLASFTFIASFPGLDSTFDASASMSPVGTIVSYAWDFGDGTPLVVTPDPVISHVYTAPGNYPVTLTVTNSAGTSTTQVFTGQSVIRNGGPLAVFTQIVQILAVPTPPTPPIDYVSPPSCFKGKVIKDKCAAHTTYIHCLSWRPSRDPSVTGYKLFRNGHLIQTIPATGPFVFKDHNRKKHKRDRYVLVAFNAQGVESTPIEVVLP